MFWPKRKKVANIVLKKRFEGVARYFSNWFKSDLMKVANQTHWFKEAH
jgi:hypothetical protein